MAALHETAASSLFVCNAETLDMLTCCSVICIHLLTAVILQGRVSRSRLMHEGIDTIPSLTEHQWHESLIMPTGVRLAGR